TGADVGGRSGARGGAGAGADVDGSDEDGSDVDAGSAAGAGPGVAVGFGSGGSRVGTEALGIAAASGSVAEGAATFDSAGSGSASFDRAGCATCSSGRRRPKRRRRGRESLNSSVMNHPTERACRVPILDHRERRVKDVPRETPRNSQVPAEC